MPGFHDYLIPSKTGLFVPPQDPLQLCQAIQTLWEDPELAELMGKYARHVYLQNYTFESLAERVVSIIHEINPSSSAIPFPI